MVHMVAFHTKLLPESILLTYLSQLATKLLTDTYIIQLNRQVEYGAIKSYYFPRGRAVIFHHTKAHCHGFNIWTERYY